MDSVDARFRDLRAAMEAEWVRMEREVEARWQRQKQEIERRWGEAVRSTKREWVDYSPSYETRSIVNFEEGTLEVTTLVPLSELGQQRIPRAAQGAVAEQLGRVLAQPGAQGKAVLDGQVLNGAGQPVTKQNREAFVQREVLPSLEVDPKPMHSPDGVERAKVTARVKLAPDHLQKRARQYGDLVLREARRHNLDPRLVFAVIQTESYFNPQAQSPAPAYGLMQLVPRAAARDAYNILYGQDRVLDPDYLTDPAHNIELGAAYLWMLMTKLFADLPPGEKQLYVVVCAYNWGPGNIRDKILKRVRIQDLSEPQVFALLSERTPEETRNYLKRVTERRALYEDLVRR